MSKFRDMAAGFLASMQTPPNPYMEQAEECLETLEPAERAQLLAQLAIAEEINRLNERIKDLRDTISMK